MPRSNSSISALSTASNSPHHPTHIALQASPARSSASSRNTSASQNERVIDFWDAALPSKSETGSALEALVAFLDNDDAQERSLPVEQLEATEKQVNNAQNIFTFHNECLSR